MCCQVCRAVSWRGGPWAKYTLLKGKIEVDYLKNLGPNLIKKLYYLNEKNLAYFNRKA